MKKVLLGTTALVAATALTTGVANAEANVGGAIYHQFGIAIDADANYANDEGLENYSTSSVQFTGGSTLDNGMEMGFTVDLTTRHGGTTTDELRFSLSDDWGRIQLGYDDPVADILDNGTPFTSYISANSGTFSHMVNSTNYGVGSMFVGTYSATLGDTAGIHYYLPDMNGLTVGVSYNNSNAAGLTSSGSTTVNDVVSIAGIYSGDMGGMTVGASAGVEHIMHLNTTDDLGDDDANRMRASLSVGTGGLNVGVAYGATDYNTSTTAKVDNWTVATAANYTSGAHTIRIEWTTSESDLTRTTGGDTRDADIYAIGYAMSMGGGVSFDAGIAHLDIADSDTVTTDDVDATVFGAGIYVGF